MEYKKIPAMQGCVFCHRKLNQGEVLHETENFFVNSGIGVAAPGHVMLIPKKHYDCCADVPVGLRAEFTELKKLVFRKVKAAFFEPFLIEYGIMGQSVKHAHLHFIPKQREATGHYAAYKIDDISKEMDISSNIRSVPAAWDSAAALEKKYGGYIYLKDGRARLYYSRRAYDGSMSYRGFFSRKLELSDIPADWKKITVREAEIDAIKREITRSGLKF